MRYIQINTQAEQVLLAYAREGMTAATTVADRLRLPYELCTCCGIETPHVDERCVFCEQELQVDKGILTNSDR